MKNLPIGLQDFKTLREGNYLYVDKTALIHRLIENGKYYFLSRPRRFGKSLLISTLQELFLGNKEVFKDLWIENQWDWAKTFPVVHISFNTLPYKEIGLIKALEQLLNELATEYGLTLEKEGIGKRFQELLIQLSQRNRVVLLIDEYDKPIIDFIDDTSQVKENREILRSFYSTIKNTDNYLHFVFITGVSKFSKVSIFSDLNNIFDITIDPNFSSLTGYSQTELEHYFADRIDKLVIQHNTDRSTLLADIRSWYNGYSWTGPERMYNPFSILSFFGKGVFQNFWFSTGTPTFLMTTLKKGWNYQLDELDVGSTQLDFFDIEDPDYRSLLFQTGYLTIKDQPTHNIYTLGYPNLEVKDSMLQYMIGTFTFRQRGDAAPAVMKLKKALDKGDTALFVSILNSLFTAIPERIFRERSEAAYHAVVYTSLSLMGYFIEAEVAAGDGYVDAVIKTATRIYVMEFKVNKAASVAIAQIRQKSYAEPYRHDGREVRLVGISFGGGVKGVMDWEEEALGE